MRSHCSCAHNQFRSAQHLGFGPDDNHWMLTEQFSGLRSIFITQLAQNDQPIYPAAISTHRNVRYCTDRRSRVWPQLNNEACLLSCFRLVMGQIWMIASISTVNHLNVSLECDARPDENIYSWFYAPQPTVSWTHGFLIATLINLQRSFRYFLA